MRISDWSSDVCSSDLTVQPPDGWEGQAYIGDGPAIASQMLDGLPIVEAKAAITDWLEEHGVGRRTVTYKLRDWLFSRQRYWGEPFPIVYDEHGLPLAVPAAELPVLLPHVQDSPPRTFATHRKDQKSAGLEKRGA